MSEPRTLYDYVPYDTIHHEWGGIAPVGAFRASERPGWLVPASVDDLSVNRARFKAHVAETLLRIQVEGGQGVITAEQWPELIEAIAVRFDREVVAALGGTDHE